VGYWADFQFCGVLHDSVSILHGWCCDSEFGGLEKWRACRDARYFFFGGHCAAGTGRPTEHNQCCGRNWNKTPTTHGRASLNDEDTYWRNASLGDFVVRTS
jgi:hypothetical protein